MITMKEIICGYKSKIGNVREHKREEFNNVIAVQEYCRLSIVDNTMIDSFLLNTYNSKKMVYQIT